MLLSPSLCAEPPHLELLKYLVTHMYPPTRRTGASSSYRSQSQGTVVIDDPLHHPYRWLEQDTTERRAWALGLSLTYQRLRSVTY
jgi:hypothetical protein